MINFKYDNSKNDIILKHEETVENELKQISQKYNLILNRLGYYLNLDKYWLVYSGLKIKASETRVPFNCVCECKVDVSITTKNGEILCIDQEEGYSLLFDYNIYSISYIYGLFKRIYNRDLMVYL